MRSRSVCLAVAVALVATLYTGTARADLNSELDNSIKGAVGCALLGANLTLIIEGAVGVRNPWLLSLIPIAVAGGGAAGGWFLGQASSEGAVASLVVGLALTVPAAVLVAWAQSYRVSRDESEGWVDRTEEGMPGEEEEAAAVTVMPTGGTETDVVGPDGDDAVAPPPDEGSDIPDSEPEEGGGGPSFGSAERPIPLPGVLRFLAEQEQRRSPRLELSFF